MKVLALTVAILALSAASAAALPCTDIYSNSHRVNGQVDNGTTVALPNGGFQTTYADGWVHTSQPDTSYGAGGRQMEDKNAQGQTVRTAKCDPKNVLRNETKAQYANGQVTLTIVAWNASGNVISKTTNTMATGAPAPSPQGQQAQPQPPQTPPSYPSAGGPPPGPPPGDQTMNGPPPGYDQGPNGPPPPPGYDTGGPPSTGPPIGIGGVGFGFGFGLGHKP
jgi:hypothetical protein